MNSEKDLSPDGRTRDIYKILIFECQRQKQRDRLRVCTLSAAGPWIFQNFIQYERLFAKGKCLSVNHSNAAQFTYSAARRLGICG
jgi:hypothetical protein